ncbi:DinB family protein [Alkalicoccobacillus porphyridii]|uniref:DinB family protein n=1 Tax=Alkalicoccobacillus porphyridii TaxID=2597270 RepID=A0A554A245_9BACI|nr:DinB family protein [Alkalicoccobacillus porphyridii]TSB47758.1 DinB family protein [Alkalicoccobacillus porphyridii]
MSDYIFTQLRFIRANTLRDVVDVNDKMSEIIPVGSNNNIKWNLGHIYLIQERFAFYFTKENMLLPELFIESFRPGTKPHSKGKIEVGFSEIIQLLEGQVDRVESTFKNRLKEKTNESYTTSKGLHLSTVEEFLSFCLYHEGMHYEKVKVIKKLLTT